ncbi:MAG: hypothetical protein HYS23_10765 [Geobacter sp.]|nr:hypothetical protein [Geobacter sp.]
MRLSIIMLTFALFMIITLSCHSEPTYQPGGPYYYSEIAGVNYPFKPIKQISLSEAQSKDLYYIAYFDDKSRITKIEKYMKGKLRFSDTYYYDNAGNLEKVDIIERSGKTRTEYFKKIN